MRFFVVSEHAVMAEVSQRFQVPGARDERGIYREEVAGALNGEPMTLMELQAQPWGRAALADWRRGDDSQREANDRARIDAGSVWELEQIFREHGDAEAHRLLVEGTLEERFRFTGDYVPPPTLRVV